MPWGRLDDKLWCNPKIVGLPDYAYRLYVQGLSWAAGQKTDGFIPQDILPVLTPHRFRLRAAALLVAAGLWEVISPRSAGDPPVISSESADDQELIRRRSAGGWQIHDWLAYNSTAAEAEKRLKAHADRVSKWRKGKRATPGDGARDASQGRNGDASRDAHVTPYRARVAPSHPPSSNEEGMGEATPPAPGEGAASPPPTPRKTAPTVLSPDEVEAAYRKGFG